MPDDDRAGKGSEPVCSVENGSQNQSLNGPVTENHCQEDVCITRAPQVVAGDNKPHIGATGEGGDQESDWVGTDGCGCRQKQRSAENDKQSPDGKRCPRGYCRQPPVVS